jgi:hypothetical protein
MYVNNKEIEIRTSVKISQLECIVVTSMLYYLQRHDDAVDLGFVLTRLEARMLSAMSFNLKQYLQKAKGRGDRRGGEGRDHRSTV